MKPYQDTAPTPKIDPVLYAAGYHLTPSRIGKERVKAYAVAVLGLAAIAGSIYVASELDAAPVVLLGLAIAIGCAIYTWTVVGDTENVRRQLWQREDAAGQDLDGDGHVGQPPVVTVGRILPIGHSDHTVTLPDLAPPPQRIALAGFPTDPPVAPNDVVYILTHATAGDGLGFRQWDKRRLPGGAEIRRDLWTGILDGLLAWQFATASTTADGRRVVNLRSDIDVETMIHTIRQGVDQ